MGQEKKRLIYQLYQFVSATLDRQAKLYMNKDTSYLYTSKFLNNLFAEQRKHHGAEIYTIGLFIDVYLFIGLPGETLNSKEENVNSEKKEKYFQLK